MDIVERLRDTGDHARFEPSLHHEAADEIERLRGRVDQLKELDDLSCREIKSLTQKVLLLESIGQRMSLSYDDLDNRKNELREENEWLREALHLYACDGECANCYGPVQHTKHCGKTARAALGEDK